MRKMNYVYTNHKELLKEDVKNILNTSDIIASELIDELSNDKEYIQSDILFKFLDEKITINESNCDKQIIYVDNIKFKNDDVCRLMGIGRDKARLLMEKIRTNNKDYYSDYKLKGIFGKKTIYVGHLLAYINGNLSFVYSYIGSNKYKQIMNKEDILKLFDLKPDQAQSLIKKAKRIDGKFYFENKDIINNTQALTSHILEVVDYEYINEG